MSVVKATMRPIRAKLDKASKSGEQLKVGIEAELGRLHKTNALLIAAQFAANHEAEFDVSDAIAAIIERVDQHIEALDELCLEASQ